MSHTALFLLHVLGFGGFVWLGLYTLTRGDRGPVALLTGVTALVTACFFLSGGLLSAPHHTRDTVLWINRVFWGAAVLPVALWLHLSIRLNPHAAAARWRGPVLWVAYGAAALLTLSGMSTDLVNNYHTAMPTTPVIAGPLYIVYVIFLFSCVGFSVVNLSMLAWRRAPEDTAPAGPAATGLLVVGGVCFLAGAGLLSLNSLLRSALDELPAYVLLLAGLGAVGATVVVQGALLMGRDVRREVVYNLVGLGLLLGLYLLATGVLVGFPDVRHDVLVFVLTALITSGHTLYNVAGGWLDGIFFTPVVREERAAARAYADALATVPAGPHPDLATPKAFEDAVRRALAHLSDPTKLATSPLLNLSVVAQAVADQRLDDDRLGRAAALKELLLELLEGLRPRDPAGRATGDAWRFYNCLYYPYVRGLGRRRAPSVLRQLGERRRRDGGPRGELEQVLEWLLQVDEDTFYKWQRRGSDTIAAALREREVAAGGPAPRAADARPVGTIDTGTLSPHAPA